MYTYYMNTQISPPGRARPFAWGAVQGRVELTSSVLQAAETHAKAYFSRVKREGFSGDNVCVSSAPRWLPSPRSWFPTRAVADLGYERASGQDFNLLATAGVDLHDDHIHGPTFVLVLFNDRLKFRQGRQSHETLSGEWFIFNDKQFHGVSEINAKATTYLCVSIGLQLLGKSTALS